MWDHSFDYRQALIDARNNPEQVKYELDSYDYYLQEELDQCPIPNFHLNKKIHGVYPITGEKFKYFKKVTESLYSILNKVIAERHRALNAGEDTFEFGEFERELIKVKPKSGELMRHVRFDAIYSPSYKSLKILECNPENPGGIWDNDFAVSCMARNGTKLYKNIFAPDGDYSKIRHHKQKDKLLNSIVSGHEKMHGKPPKTIAVGLFPEDKEDFVAHCDVLFFKSRGYESFVVNPCELKYRDGKVFSGERQIDVLLRGFLMMEVKEHTHELDDLSRAYINNDFCVIPPFSDALGNSKALMAEIPTKYAHVLTKTELKLVSEVFPNADVITPENYERIMTSLINKVIKPGEGFGGFGVIVGREAIDQAVPSLEHIEKDEWIVQEYYPHENIKCPYYADGKVTIETVNIVLGNLAILGEYTGTLVRGSLTNIINTHQGAEILTPFDLDYRIA